MKKLLCILSTGRSGTSVLSNIASSINFKLSDHLIGAHPTNVKGHFEDIIILDRNEHFLKTIGKNFWTTEKFSTEENDYFKVRYSDEMVVYLDHLLTVKQKVVIKEPRLSKMFHLWQDIFSRLDCKIYFLVVYRSPLLYTKSTIKAYQNIDIAKGAKVWFYHNYNVLDNLKDNDSVMFLNFSEFIKDIPNYTRKIAGFVEETVDYPKFIEYFSSFYEKELVNFTIDENCGIKYADDLFHLMKTLNYENFDFMKNQIKKWNLDDILNN